MVSDTESYLKTQIIGDNNTITYRILSRALKIHVNTAKQQLEEFYQKESARKKGSVYATYLLIGTKSNGEPKKSAHDEITNGSPSKRPPTNGHAKDIDGDSFMPDSPPASSFQISQSQQTEVYNEPVKTTTISLVHETDLESAKAQYTTLLSSHIYSVSPTPLQDLHVLSDCSRQVFTDYHCKLDPLIHNKDYGTITNPNVRRRKGKRPVNIEAEPMRIESKKAPIVAGSTKTLELKNQETNSSRPGSRDSTTAPPSLKTEESTGAASSKTKPTQLKASASSIFKAFAKQSAKPKLERKDSSASVSTNQGQKNSQQNGDPKMTDNDESEDEALFLDTNTKKFATGSKKRTQQQSEASKEQEERAKRLKKMMDDDDEETEVPSVAEAAGLKGEQLAPPAAKSGEDADAPDGTAVEDGAEGGWSDSDAERNDKINKAKKQTATGKSKHSDRDLDDVAGAAPNRKRGRRKVLKKRTVKDEDGYLVTREEEVFESFSESEEPEERKVEVKKEKVSAPALKSMSSGLSSSQASGKGGVTAGSGKGKKGTATGQKGIAGFFGKK